jgi:hypothetical protein
MLFECNPRINREALRIRIQRSEESLYLHPYLFIA